jgi:PPOX class probable F420-dependent enzyme
MANTTIPDTHKDLLENPYYAVVTTVMPDGQPQSTVVWADYDGKNVRFNTARGRQKDKNLERDPKVTLVIVDPNDGYHWLEVRGIAHVTEEGGREQIEALSHKYMGQKYYGGYNTWKKPEDETRLVVTIEATKVSAH